MIDFLTRLFGSANERVVKRLQPTIDAINELEDKFRKLSDQELKAKTDEFRQSLANGGKLEDVLIPAFATVREAADRTLGMRHFDVQLLGGIILHQGKITEMLTGEGKTLVATLPVYLNALAGKGVHVITVNDYLARRDAEWMGEIYRFLGLSVGCIIPGLNETERQAAYAADITYGTNNEFAFDYLRDNMKFRRQDMVQRDFNYAIVDEVDSILIDEARTPLIISGPAESSTDMYVAVDKIIPKLTADDFELDEKHRNITLTDKGQEHVEELLNKANLLQGAGLYDIQNVGMVHHVNQALKAHKLFQKDRDYLIKDGQVVIVDEFTGRMMAGRRYSDGLHQALEAKESVEIQMENQTLASVTFQNYFRMYPKLAGMTGTAQTEAAEFAEIYKLEVVSIPPNVPVQRVDHQDEIYQSVSEKMEAIVKLIEDCRKRQQPILVGTVTIERSEQLAALLKKRKIPHNVLNARHHEQEAHIVAQAGRPGQVTIATNMAGRGTDIQLGGNLDMLIEEELGPESDEGGKDAARDKKIEDMRKQIAADKKKVLAAGGLYVIGTERHESRRIDNQLRGRSGRQGDPGASKFFLSLEDDLMRIFASEKLQSFIGKLGLEPGEPISHPWVSRALEKAQQKVEGRNFEIRKQLLKFDDVMNAQRQVIYGQRREIIDTDNVQDIVDDMRHETVEELVSSHIPAGAYAEQWDVEALSEEAKHYLNVAAPVQDWAAEEGIVEDEIEKRLLEASDRQMQGKAATFTPELMRMAEKAVLLQVLDQSWKDHLLSLDHLRQGISLRAYAQQDPLNEYKREAFSMFEDLLSRLRQQVTHILSHIEPRAPNPDWAPRQQQGVMRESRQDPALASQGGGQQAGQAPSDAGPVITRRSASGAPLALDPNDPKTWGRVPRNAPCPCGSGKKYKHCHGQAG